MCYIYSTWPVKDLKWIKSRSIFQEMGPDLKEVNFNEILDIKKKKIGALDCNWCIILFKKFV